MTKSVLVLNFGSQYVQLIARKVRELGVYSEIVPYTISKEEILEKKPCAIILSGGPYSVYEEDAPLPSFDIYNLNIPILGICYGLQALTYQLGGKVSKAQKREYGRSSLKLLEREDDFFTNLPESFDVWMSHADKIEQIPPSFKVLAKSDNSPFCAIKKGLIYGVQFHPEVYHSNFGKELLSNFLFNVARCEKNWSMENFVDQKIKEIKDIVKDDKVICALSGGVDSTVAAVLTHRAIKDNLYPIFIDHGLLRKNEREEVESFLKEIGLKVMVIDASSLFLERLKDVEDPEQKRKIIGNTFIDVFEKEASKLDAKFLLQGTLYPDVVESAGISLASNIKTHHNVGGLPEKMNLKLLEPFRELFKDEVRKIGKLLGIKDSIINRHPFPGPGLAIRIIGKITKEDLDILREADAIFIEELRKNNLYDKVWQAFCVLLPIRSVGVMGDNRTYDKVLALRAVDSVDGMTADWSKLPTEFLDNVSRRIIQEVKGINRVVYDISSKPPSTIEWE